MPSVSRHAAEHRITDGPVEFISADLDGGYTINFPDEQAARCRSRLNEKPPNHTTTAITVDRHQCDPRRRNLSRNTSGHNGSEQR
jgi:hypothetical protein